MRFNFYHFLEEKVKNYTNSYKLKSLHNLVDIKESKTKNCYTLMVVLIIFSIF
jgi:hypothetical protein